MRSYIIVICSLIVLTQSHAQITLPVENSELNFTQILFQTKEVEGANRYFFVVENEDSVQWKKEQWDSTYVSVFNGLLFNSNYKWSVQAYKNDQLIHTSQTFHFSIGTSPFIDDNNYRYTVTKDIRQEKSSGVLFLDYSNVAIDGEGKPVWYLPINGKDQKRGRLRDLKMTEEGTLTFLAMNEGTEITLDNQVLWSTPATRGENDDSTQFYHHEFTKLNTGNYMVLGKSYELKTLTLNDQSIDKIPISIVIEYDENGDTTWFWSSRKYITDDDLLKVGKKVFNGNTFGHSNSLATNRDGSKIYIGFRDLNSVLVVDRKTRQLIQSYGDKVPSDTTKNAIGFFKKQHAAYPLENNQVLLFNNNDRGLTSSVVIFSEVNESGKPSELIWEFTCDFDTLFRSGSERMGNAQQKPNGNILVNMGDVARLFEVTKDKEVVWDCHPEKWNSELKQWTPFSNYRLNYQSSLYPKYFSVSLRKDENNNQYFLIQNEGSENDSYTVAFAVKGKKVKDEIKLNIPSEKGEKVYVNDYFSEKQLKKEITIKVISNSNSRQVYERNINFQ